MKKLILSLILTAAFFTLSNQSSEKIVMSLAWVDHDFEMNGVRYPAPATMCMAELKPGKEFDGAWSYPGNVFICTAGNRFKQFRTFSGDHRIVCTWDGELIQVAEKPEN